MTTVDLKTAAATELESELDMIFRINACFWGIVSVVSVLALSPVVLIFSSIWRLYTMWICFLLGEYLLSLYFSQHLDLEEGYKIRRWCRKKLVAFSVILPGQDRSRINKAVFLLEEEETHRYLSRRTTTDATLTELEWELKIIFEENSFYAGAGAALCMGVFFITALLAGVVLSERTSIALVLWFMIWFCILFVASVVNYNRRGPLDLDERDKWLTKKIVACSVMLPYQDPSRINKALLLMDKKEDEKPQKVEQEHSKA